MSRRSWELRARDIIQASDYIRDYVRGMDRDAFLENRMAVAAVFHELTVIGGAARSIHAEIGQRTPKIPWVRIIGMRNRMVHEYFRIDASIVWETIRDALPDFADQMRELLPTIGDGAEGMDESARANETL